jgi:PilZ domain
MITSLPKPPIQRHHERVPYFEPVHILRPQPVITQAVDLCLGGIGLRSPLKLELGTEIEMESHAGQAVFWGKISWCRSLGSGFKIGAEFTHVDLNLLTQILHGRTGKR